MKPIGPAQLVPMDIFAQDLPLRVDLAYAQPAPKSFCGAVYRPGARLWLHEDLAAVVLLACRACHEKHGLRAVLYDGLRTVTAQETIRDTAAVRANPQWLEGETRLLSPPGQGAHPRGMAIDLSLETADGTLLDMGTPFDELSTGGAGPAVNRAHRDHSGQTETARRNRAVLTQAMTGAAAALGLPLLPLPQEWWDFRFPPEIYNACAPLADPDLPPQMRMTNRPVPPCAPQEGPADFPPAHFNDMKKMLLARIAPPSRACFPL